MFHTVSFPGPKGLEHLSLSQSYAALSLFWITYLAIGLLTDYDPRSRHIITKSQVLLQLFYNIIATYLVVPFTHFVPQILLFDPTWYGYMSKYIVLCLLIDFWFYYAHRIMHTKLFYRFHAMHHKFIDPCALSGLYCSVFEMILVNFLSTAIPYRLLNMSFLEVCIWNCFVAYNVLLSHDHKMGASRIHVMHHNLLTVNYGAFYVWDDMHGTYRDE